MAKTKTEKTTKRRTTKKATVNSKKKPTRKARKPRRKKIKDLNLWTYDENQELAIVKVPVKYRMDFLRKFGVLEPANKSEVVSWLKEIKNQEVVAV